MSKGKERLDLLLVQRGLAGSREKAKATVMAGLVYIDGQKIDKPGMEVAASALVEIKGDTLPYVSRGGLKLAKAIEAFDLSFAGMVVADIGASTGGFTDCALQNGASRVYAIDVGYGQLDWKLRTDPRVVVYERTNARYLEQGSLPEQVDWVVCDVAFISVTKIFPAMLELLKPDGQVMTLIKPQFEAGREHVGKKGVVKDENVQRQVLLSVMNEAERLGFTVQGLDYSPIRGPEGNIEFLVWLTRSPQASLDWKNSLEELVEKAHQETR
ncbi:TlyA family RNA methyltransferase [Paradesulfitobacterium aromaticivorans]